MHLKSVLRNLSLLILLVVVAMGIPLIWSAWEYLDTKSLGSWEPLRAIVLAMATGTIVSLLLFLLGRKAAGRIEIKEALLLVTLAWFGCSMVGALPFYFWALQQPLELQAVLEFRNFINCYFETISGLTSTGASILSDIERIPRSLLLWRALIQWLGGLGIVVLFVAVLPWISSGSTRIYKAETTGISETGTSDIREMSRGLWLIYMGFTALQAMIMKAVQPEMDWFTVITFGLCTSSTGGFSVFNQSAGPLSALNQWVVILFMIIGGVNYALYFECVKRRFRAVKSDLEIKYYLLFLLIAIVLVTINIHGTSYHEMNAQPANQDVLTSLRHASFQVVTMMTSTGMSTAISDQWPLFSHMILLLVTICGGCGGSTSGGIKVIRLVAASRLLLLDIEKVYRPAIIRPLVVGGKILDRDGRQGVLVFILLALVIMVTGTVTLALFENSSSLDLQGALSAVVACFSNAGPGFGLVGVTANYGFFTDASKLLLSFVMVVGRLEVFTVLAVLLPRFWIGK